MAQERVYGRISGVQAVLPTWPWDLRGRTGGSWLRGLLAKLSAWWGLYLPRDVPPSRAQERGSQHQPCLAWGVRVCLSLSLLLRKAT